MGLALLVKTIVGMETGNYTSSMSALYLVALNTVVNAAYSRFKASFKSVTGKRMTDRY